MRVKTAKQIGFWTAMAMLFGSIVGIGIFFKNGSITDATGGNGVATLLAWIIGGVISLFAAVTFSEMGSQKLRNVFGLAAWSEKALGKKFGYFTRINLPVFYFGILTVIFGVFVSEAFFKIIQLSGKLTDMPIWVHIIVAIFIDAFFISINFISTAKASWISRASTVLKIAPLVLAAFAGIILANTNNNINGIQGVNAFHNGKEFSFTGLLAALPAVLFAYDAFLSAGTYTNKVKGGSKTVSKVIVLTMISVLVLYSLISVSHIIHGAGYVGGFAGGLFDQIFPASAQKGLNTFVWVFLFFSACGVQNGVTAAGISSTQQAVATRTIAGSWWLSRRFGDTKTSWIVQSIIYVFWAIPIFTTAIILKSDAIVDGISNFPTLFFFGIYGLTILGYTIKRRSSKTERINNKLFWTSAILALIGIMFVVVYEAFYGFTVDAFLHMHEHSSAGLFVGGPLTKMDMFYVFIASLVMFIGFPILNWFVTKKFETNDVIIDTQELNNEKAELV